MASLQACVVPFEQNLHRERKHTYKCRKEMTKEEAFTGAVVCTALLATLGFPERCKRGLRVSSPESPSGELPPQWWPLESRYGQCFLRILVTWANEAVLGWSSPRDAGSRREVGFCGTHFPWWGSRLFYNPYQICPRDLLRELLSLARKQLPQRNYFSIGVMFPEISSSFSLGTG